METTRPILVIGGGPAGTFAAIAAKRQNPDARVVLLTEEPCEPYEKPPLSKGVLIGKVLPADAPIAGPGGLAAHGVVLECHARCQSIDRDARTLVLEDGRRLPYGTLVIATGSLVRELPHLPVGMPHVHYLRTEADAQRLTMKLREMRRLLVVGAGLIGLEVAASAAELGVPTTVLELAPRILARVCDEEIGGLVEAEHRRRGVHLCLGCAVTSVAAVGDETAVLTTTGERVSADLIVVGTGAKPNDRLAASAGLAVDDGIVVDAYCRTSDPAIFAAGDVVRFPGPHGPVRLENWRHAQDQGVVAGRNAAGGSEPYLTIPSFWSEQYDLYIQGVGWPVPSSRRVRRPLPGNAALIFDVSDGRLVGAQGINVQKDLAAVRRLIERRTPVDPAALADPSQPLAAMLKRGGA
jgi:3-phenylpropionate/trans-cinnamate dioxygenase ferredoxin reductase component